MFQELMPLLKQRILVLTLRVHSDTAKVRIGVERKRLYTIVLVALGMLVGAAAQNAPTVLDLTKPAMAGEQAGRAAPAEGPAISLPINPGQFPKEQKLPLGVTMLSLDSGVLRLKMKNLSGQTIFVPKSDYETIAKLSPRSWMRFDYSVELSSNPGNSLSTIRVRSSAGSQQVDGSTIALKPNQEAIVLLSVPSPALHQRKFKSAKAIQARATVREVTHAQARVAGVRSVTSENSLLVKAEEKAKK